MVDLAPFRGVRFAAGAVGSLAEVTAPPYDAIDPATQRRLYAASPYNVVRLELGRDRPGDTAAANRYTRARDAYGAWIGEGVLQVDPAPSLYVYAQQADTPAGGHRQVGILGALRLTPWEAGAVLPHERVFPDPVADRLRLLHALPVNVSPVFVVHDGTTPPATAARLDGLLTSRPELEFTCDEGIRHRCWPVTDEDTQMAIAADLADREVLMADGHHRYTTALEFQREPSAPPGAARILALVAYADRGPTIRPVHRLVPSLPRDWRQRLRQAGVTVEPRTTGRDGAGADGPRGDGFRARLTTRDGAAVLTGPHPADERGPRIDIAAVQHLLVRVLGLAEHDLVYTTETEGPRRRVVAGEMAALVEVPPPPLTDVVAAARVGRRLPPKSTSFFPKPRTGLVLRDLSEGPAGP